MLVSKNLIDIRSRSGGRVRDVAAWNLLDPDILLWRSQGEDQEGFVTELFELRRVIEPAAAALAASRITPAQLAELEARLPRHGRGGRRHVSASSSRMDGFTARSSAVLAIHCFGPWGRR